MPFNELLGLYMDGDMHTDGSWRSQYTFFPFRAVFFSFKLIEAG